MLLQKKLNLHFRLNFLIFGEMPQLFNCFCGPCTIRVSFQQRNFNHLRFVKIEGDYAPRVICSKKVSLQNNIHKTGNFSKGNIPQFKKKKQFTANMSQKMSKNNQNNYMIQLSRKNFLSIHVYNSRLANWLILTESTTCISFFSTVSFF